MKTVKKFNKAFPVCAILSCAVILFGIIGFFVRGINFGIDFVPGLVEEVRIAPAVMELSYKGSATVSVETTNTGLSLVISGTGAENETRTFTYGQNSTIQDMANALSTVEGVIAKVVASANADSYGIYTDSAVSARLTSDSVYRLYVPEENSSVNIDSVRAALEGKNVEVKALGDKSNPSFQIRAAMPETEASVKELQDSIVVTLREKFGADNVATVKTDFVGSQMSSSLAVKSIVLAFVTLLLIWLYATIRFHWDFALGSIIALVHDCLIMFTFITWTQIEFSTTTLAAILTIFGYSINATVVILDRLRENTKTLDTKNFSDILNISISETMTRSIITTVTTLFAAIALLVFTKGSIKTFAEVLTVGLVSGCYSSIFISSGFIEFVRRNWNGENKKKSEPNKNVLTMTDAQ